MKGSKQKRIGFGNLLEASVAPRSAAMACGKLRP